MIIVANYVFIVTIITSLSFIKSHCYYSPEIYSLSKIVISINNKISPDCNTSYAAGSVLSLTENCLHKTCGYIINRTFPQLHM